MDLVNELYNNKRSKLYYGFLQERGNSNVKIIITNLSVKNDASVFAQAVEKLSMLTDELIEEHLLHIYVHSHRNDVDGGHELFNNKYPPTNETMMKLPHTLRDWKESAKNQHDCEYINLIMQLRGLSAAQLLYTAKPPPNKVMCYNCTAIDDDNIIVVKFI